VNGQQGMRGDILGEQERRRDAVREPVRLHRRCDREDGAKPDGRLERARRDDRHGGALDDRERGSGTAEPLRLQHDGIDRPAGRHTHAVLHAPDAHLSSERKAHAAAQPTQLVLGRDGILDELDAVRLEHREHRCRAVDIPCAVPVEADASGRSERFADGSNPQDRHRVADLHLRRRAARARYEFASNSRAHAGHHDVDSDVARYGIGKRPVGGLDCRAVRTGRGIP
jgi:hypothetical protein